MPCFLGSGLELLLDEIPDTIFTGLDLASTLTQSTLYADIAETVPSSAASHPADSDVSTSWRQMCFHWEETALSFPVPWPPRLPSVAWELSRHQRPERVP